MLELNAKTALVVIDLQEGILPFAGGPHRADDVVERAASLAEKCRQQGSPVVMVRVGWSADFAEALKQPVDAQAGAHTLPENWWTYPLALVNRRAISKSPNASGAPSTAPTWSCSFAVAVSTPLFCAVSPPTSASNPPRNAWELGFNLVLVEDACSAASAEQHQGSMTHIFPRIARVRSTEEVLAAL
jgi:nicotinamidase-related amidase